MAFRDLSTCGADVVGSAAGPGSNDKRAGPTGCRSGPLGWSAGAGGSARRGRPEPPPSPRSAATRTASGTPAAGRQELAVVAHPVVGV